jgi:hypothetical protein
VNATPRGATTTRSRLDALARLIQFRSELAILAVLAMGIGAGAVARMVLRGGLGPPAIIAAPSSDPATRPTSHNSAPGAARPLRPPEPGHGHAVTCR